MSNTLIRPYRPTDWHEWHRMHRALFPDTPEPEVWMHAFLKRPVAIVFVADLGPQCCGYISITAQAPFCPGPSARPFGYIEAFWVDPEFRAKGVGRELQKAACVWARVHGFDELGADIVVGNDLSLEVHEKLGYERVESVTHVRKWIGK